MPFLRRRGVMASESDMRRHTSFFHNLSTPKRPLQPSAEADGDARPPSSASFRSTASNMTTATAESVPPVPAIPPIPALLSASQDGRPSTDSAGLPTSTDPILRDASKTPTPADITRDVSKTPTPADSYRIPPPPPIDTSTADLEAPSTLTLEAMIHTVPPTLPAIAPALPDTPTSQGRPASHGSRTSRAGGRSVSAGETYLPPRPSTPPVHEETGRHRRFSLMRFRNASDSQLAARARLQAQADVPPPIPRPPEIITTAPTLEFATIPESGDKNKQNGSAEKNEKSEKTEKSEKSEKRPPRLKLGARMRKSTDVPCTDEEANGIGSANSFGSWSRKGGRKSSGAQSASSTGKNPAIAFDESTLNQRGAHTAPPEYGDDAASGLALPVNRLSESSRSDGSSGDRVYGSTTTTTHTVHTTTTFFRLPRRRKTNPSHLFPIGHLPQKGQGQSQGQQAPPTTPIEQTMPTLSREMAAVDGTPEEPAGVEPIPRPPSRMSLFTGGLGFHNSSNSSNSINNNINSNSKAEAEEVPRSMPDATVKPAGDGLQTPTQSRPSSQRRVLASPSKPLQSPAVALFQKGNHSPAGAFFRTNSRNSGHSSPTRSMAVGPGAALGVGVPSQGRGRSSTFSSVGRDSEDHLAPPGMRNSLSNTGRKSFSDLLGISRLRQNSEPLGPLGQRNGALTPITPGSSASKNNSLQIPRDSIILPERRDDDTPAKYLARLEEVVSRSVIASALSKSTDTFSQAVLRSYMRSFKFFGDPMDMAIRKLLMEAELPRETQQIDRCLQAFANRYHECNPGIYSSPDQAYFIAFSLLILHTDVFNKNNKHKMQKPDYLKNTRGEGIYDEVLEVFYDNITYTPFIHVEDEIDINGERIVAHKAKRKSIFPNYTPDLAKKSAKEPIDPYTLIIDSKLEILRPNLKDVMQMDDPYSYLGTAEKLNMEELQKTFFRTGVLQIVSARSRPDAFMSEKTATNPEEAHPGIVDIKITKVGLLWRKDAKKKKTRSPWQEWGAILTGAQLYFFRNTAWVKSLVHQYETHIRHGQDGIPIIFQPPLEEFKPDALMSTDGAIALLDSSYKKHKHAFTYVRHGGLEEVLLADNEEEMNDWLAKLNYAAAFRTSGVRMRGVVGGNYDGQNRRALRRLDDSQSVQTATGEVTINRSRIDQKMALDILAARRDIMLQKVADANDKLEQEEKQLQIQLRNARHLQIMAPIQPKTREQMLLSAARMATQLKWTRVDMWRLKCHRDILEMDLDEERQVNGLGPEHALESGAAFAGLVSAGLAIDTSTTSLGMEGPQQQQQQQQQQPQEQRLFRPQSPQQQQMSALSREESKASSANTALQRSPRSPTHRGSLASGSIGSTSAMTVPSSLLRPESPTIGDAFQTPPSTAMGFVEDSRLRKASVSSVISSGGHSISATPPRAVRTTSVGADKSQPRPQPQKLAIGIAMTPEDAKHEHEHDPNAVDADEQHLLEKTGLLESPVLGSAAFTTSTPKGKHPITVDETGSPVVTDKQQQQQQTTPLHGHHHGKKDIRRSLQRTFRESAGHLSHHRSRRTKDVSIGSAAEGAEREPNVLSRGTGSFVVHGKKASVINFGGDLQSIVPSEERIMRQRKSHQHSSPGAAAANADEGASPLSGPGETGDNNTIGDSSIISTSDVGGGESISDIQVLVTSAPRRASSASASTATARSFRDLHRKYSYVRAASKSSQSGKGPVLAADDDVSEVAVSFSDGRRSPLPPPLQTAKAKLPEEEEEHTDDDDYDSAEEGNGYGSLKAGRIGNGNDGDGDHDSLDDDDDEAQAQFYTPDPPATPRSMTPEPETRKEKETGNGKGKGKMVEEMKDEGLEVGPTAAMVANPAVQAVHA